MNNTNDDSGNLVRGINRLNDVLDLLMDTLEKGARSNTPNSMYFGRRRVEDKTFDIDEANFKDFIDLNNEELGELKKIAHDNTRKAHDSIKSDIDRLTDAISRETDSAAKSVLQQRKDEAEIKEKSLSEQVGLIGDIERLSKLISSETDDARKNVLEAAKAQKEQDLLSKNPTIYTGTQAARQADANSRVAGTKFETKAGRDAERSNNARINAENDAYEARRHNLQNISMDLSHSGLANNSIGRSFVNATNRQQSINALGNFGNNLRGKGGASIAQGLFGTGKAAGHAASMLGKFGGLLGKVSKVLGGPILTVLSFLFDALKAVGKVANEYQKQTAMFIRYQTEIERISYEQSKQHATLTTQIDVETVKYIGDMALKLMETQGANMLEAMDILNSQFVKSMEIGTGSIMKGINQTAYDAAMASIDAGASMRKMEQHQTQRATQMELYGTQRGFETEKNIASALSDINVADAAAAVERLTKANELEQNQLDMAAQATGNLMSGDFVGAISNGMGFFRNAENNTTTGEYASGDTNPMNASKVKIDTYKAFGVDKIPGWESSLVGPNAVGAATMGVLNGGDRSGYREKETAIVENAAQHITQDADAVKTKTELHYSKAGAELDNRVKLAEKETDIVTQAAEKTIDAATAVEKNWLALTQHIEGFIEKFDKRFNDLALNLGFLNQTNLFDYKQGQFSVIANVARSFGKTEEEVAKYQSGYVEDTGRSKLFDLSDTRQLAALGTYLGDDGLATRFASEMEIFNAGAAESVDLLDESLQSVNKIGLNGRKYTKDLVNNLKIAQKYNFKGGTKEVMEMAKWAQKTRFNLQSLGGIVDKIQEGGLEGVLQQSAQFQVLGGHAAMNSDPLGMLYDAWGDNFALAKRFQDMTKGFGTLNKKTGETTFDNITENMQIAAIAKAQGRSVEELRGEIMERNKREVVSNQLSAAQRQTFDKDQIDYLGSVAKYNKKNQQFEVTLANGETRGINEITPEELEHAMPKEHDERMETWMEQLVSVVSKMSGETVAENAEVASAVYKNTLDSFNTRLQEMHNSYLSNFDEFVKHTKDEQDRIEVNVKDYLTQFANNLHEDTTGINAEVANIKGKANDIANALGGVAEVIQTAKQDIARASGMDISTMPGHRDADTIYNTANERVGKSKSDQKSSETPDPNNYQKDLREKTGGNLSRYNPNTGTFNGQIYAPSDATSVAVNRMPPSYPRINDGIVGGDNQPMMVAAKDVTPINDGSFTLAQSSKNDVGMFLEQGGPLDTLFNGIFGEIHSVSDIFNGWIEEHNRQRGLMQGRSTVEPKVLPQEDALEKLYNEWSKPQERVADRTNVYTDKVEQNIPSGKRDINVNINGRLTLDCGNQTIDFLSLMKADPMIVRRITEQVADQIYKNQNGGKTEGPGAGVRYSSMA